jgi:hypothetical protein
MRSFPLTTGNSRDTPKAEHDNEDEDGDELGVGRMKVLRKVIKHSEQLGVHRGIHRNSGGKRDHLGFLFQGNKAGMNSIKVCWDAYRCLERRTGAKIAASLFQGTL